MLKKSASSVLASLRGSTYRSVHLASSLAAALLDGLFEHPAHSEIFSVSYHVRSPRFSELRAPHSRRHVFHQSCRTPIRVRGWWSPLPAGPYL